MDPDVEVKFVADLEAMKRDLDEMNEYIHGWGFQIKEFLTEHVGNALIEIFKKPFEYIKEGFLEVKDFIKESIEAAEEHELVFERLKLSIDHMRGGFGLSAESVEEWSVAIEKSTGVAHEGIERVAASLARFHIGGGTFIDAVKASLNVSAETGGSAEGEASKIGRALAGLEQGQGQAARRLREELADLTEAEKNHIQELAKSGQGHEAVKLVVEELNRKYADAAEVIGNTLHGQLEKLHNTVHRVYEEMGNAFLPTLKELVPVITGLAGEVERLAMAFAHSLQELANTATSKEGIEAIKDGLVSAFFYAEEFFKRVPNYVKTIFAEIMKGISEVGREIDNLIANMPGFLIGQGNVDAANLRITGLTPEEIKQANAEFMKIANMTDLDEQSDAFEAYAKKWKRDSSDNKAIADYEKSIKDLNEQLEKMGTYSDNVKKDTEEFHKHMKESATEAEKLEKHLREIAQLQQLATEASQRYGPGLSRMGALPLGGMLGGLAAATDPFGGAGMFGLSVLPGAQFAQGAYDYRTSMAGGIGVGSPFGMMQAMPLGGLTNLFGGGAATLAGLNFGLGTMTGKPGEMMVASELDKQIESLRERMAKDKHVEPFKSAIEDASSVFKRIQVAAAGDDKSTEKDMLKTQMEHLELAKKRLAKAEADEKKWDAFAKEMLAETKKPRAAVAGGR